MDAFVAALGLAVLGGLAALLQWLRTGRVTPPTNQYQPNPDTGAPEPKPDEEYPDEAQEPPEEYPAPEGEPEPEPPPTPDPEPPTVPTEPGFYVDADHALWQLDAAGVWSWHNLPGRVDRGGNEPMVELAPFEPAPQADIDEWNALINPAPSAPPAPPAKPVYTVEQQDAFLKAIGLPYGSTAVRRASWAKFQRAVTWKDPEGKYLEVDGRPGWRTTAVAETCVANDHRISKYFHLYEFRCKGQDAKYHGAHCTSDCQIIFYSRLMVQLLDVVREKVYKGPLSITIGYRCVGYNKFVGGIVRSAHILGLAADIPRRFSWRRFLGIGFKGLGKSRVDRESIVHVDLDPNTHGYDVVFQE